MEKESTEMVVNCKKPSMLDKQEKFEQQVKCLNGEHKLNRRLTMLSQTVEYCLYCDYQEVVY